MKAVIRTKRRQRQRRRKNFCIRRRGEVVIGIQFVNGLARVGVRNQNPPIHSRCIGFTQHRIHTRAKRSNSASSGLPAANPFARLARPLRRRNRRPRKRGQDQNSGGRASAKETSAMN